MYTGAEQQTLTILPAQPAQGEEAGFDLWRRANMDSTLVYGLDTKIRSVFRIWILVRVSLLHKINMGSINVDLINVFFCKNCILVYIN